MGNNEIRFAFDLTRDTMFIPRIEDIRVWMARIFRSLPTCLLSESISVLFTEELSPELLC